MIKTIKFLSILALALPLTAGVALAQTTPTSGPPPVDPGVQSGNRLSPTFPALSSIPVTNDPTQANLSSFFLDGLNRFATVESVVTPTGGNGGLGPRFNDKQCSACHSQPVIGGSGPAVNPQFRIAGSSTSPHDTTPYFVTANGPTREARFPFFFNPDGSANTAAPNGGVEDLFTVSGAVGATTCSLQQPSFNAAKAANDIIFRIPTPLFGAGLIENLDDSTLLTNQQNNLNNFAGPFGVAGTFNHNGNDGTITRFGWKAQNKSLHIFSGEAYNVEMGISNLLFGQDRPLPGEDQQGVGLPAGCLNLDKVGYPEDSVNPTSANAAVLDDVSAFANFMRGLAAPPPSSKVLLNGVAVSAASIAQGRQLFSSIGCVACHNTSPGTTQQSNFTAGLSNVQVNAFSDIEIHHMGSTLVDNVSQGGAGGDQFRTAPLWGVGQRIFLLHDGRTTDLLAAIEAHEGNGSEANTVEQNFNNLNFNQQQALLNFLRSL